MKPALILFLFSFELLHSEVCTTKGDENQENFKIVGDGFNSEDMWDEGEIHILSRQLHKRTRRTISSHLDEIQIISGNRQIDIQLEPIHSHLSSVHFRDGEYLTSVPLQAEDERPNCHWRGHVKGGGSATFSTCQESNFFTGTVLTEEGLWLIRPKKNQDDGDSQNGNRIKSRTRRDRNKDDRISHFVLPPEKTAEHDSSWRAASDVARVPLIELEGAARLAAKDAALREAQKDFDYEDEPAVVILITDDENETEEEEEMPVAGFLSYFPRWLRWDYYNNGGEDDEDDFSANFPFLGRFREERRPRRPLLTRDPVIVMDRKIRELENKKKWVEMALFTDESMYKRMEKKFPNDTLVKLKDYASTMVNTMDLLYGDKSLGVDIGFRLVHLEVMKKPPKTLDTNGGKAKAYLTSFCDYAGNQNVNSGLWDHALLLTGLDLHEQGLKSTAGLAWSGTMCYRYYSCSVAEGNSLGAAFIITHEIGHSLGMEHDGVGVSEVCDRDKFIMSPTTGAGKVSWSNCSGKNLNDFIEYGTSELRSKKYPSQMLSKPTCLSEIVAKGKSSTTKPKLPGETYDAYFQCSLGLGTNFKPYFQRNKSPFNNICNILYCGNGTHAVSTHPAMEGTKCDKDKYCRGGNCIKRPRR